MSEKLPQIEDYITKLLEKVLGSDFTMAALTRYVGYKKLSPDYPVDPELKNDIEVFFNRLINMSIQASFTPNGLDSIKSAFRHFLKQQNCTNALQAFDALCEEKGPNNFYRADGVTPNILHEIRNCAHQLNFILRGFIPPQQYFYEGGLDADMTARLRHDSIEDHGQTLTGIFADMEKILHGMDIPEDELRLKLQQASRGVEAANLMSRKDTVLDETGKPKRTTDGKIEKKERYGGDTGVYFAIMQRNIFALLGKYADRIENVTTRWGVPRFDPVRNRQYARQTREIYGLEAYDLNAMKRWPHFDAAIACSDAMLGLSVRILEGINKYKSNEHLDPQKGRPFRFNHEVPAALIPYQDLPEIFHPIAISIHMASREIKADPRMKIIIEDLIIPPLKRAAAENNLRPLPIRLDDNPPDTHDLKERQGGGYRLLHKAVRAPVFA